MRGQQRKAKSCDTRGGTPYKRQAEGFPGGPERGEGVSYADMGAASPDGRFQKAFLPEGETNRVSDISEQR